MATLQKRTPLVSIILLNYHTEKYLDVLLPLLKNKEVEVIVIDNNQNNRGFSGGNNSGVSKAEGEWIFFLNPDTLCTADNVLQLVEEAKKNGMDVAVPKLVYENKSPQHNVGYFDPLTKNLINYIFLRPRFIHTEKVHKPIRVNCATGAALLIKRDLFLKIGMFDQKNFFMYFEDIDLSYRLYKKNIPILLVPQVVITHFEGKSADQNKIEKNKNYQNGLRSYILKHRGILLFLINKVFGFFK